MIVVTGGCGMIGSNIVAALNAAGHTDIMVVDDLTNGHKFNNIADLSISDYDDIGNFIVRVDKGLLPPPDAIFHQGAISTTTEWNGKVMMERNFLYSRTLLHYCLDRRVPFLYASSASVYGGGSVFREEPQFERPLNVYGYSKKVFDDHVRHYALGPGQSPVVGIRYFNVYGPNEGFKGSMSSVALRMFGELRRGETAKLFSSYGGFGPGEHRRDFIHVEDVAAVNLWLWGSGKSGIFNCGSGRAEPFNTIAETMIETLGYGTVEYVDFPEHLKGRYQGFTEADMTRLRAAGYTGTFRDLRTGIKGYVEWLQAQQSL